MDRWTDGRTDRQTDRDRGRHEEANSRSLSCNFANPPDQNSTIGNPINGFSLYSSGEGKLRPNTLGMCNEAQN